MEYPVELQADDNGTMLITFPDVPGAITFGDDRADALSRAVDALETVLMGLIADRKDIPVPSPRAGRPTVAPTLIGTMKLAIYQAMRARGWRKADLARALAVDPRQIDRLLDLRHRSPLAPLEAALAACGKAARVEVVDMAA